MHFLDCLVWIFLEGVLERVRHVLIEEFDLLGVLLGASEVDGIFMGDGFEFIYFVAEEVVLLLVAVDVALFDEHFSGLRFVNVKDSEWELRPFHLMDEISTGHQAK